MGIICYSDFFGLMFLGGSAGSTAGGIKIVRHLLIIRNGLLEFKRTLHPNAILPVRYNGRAVPKEIIYNVLAFLSFIYCLGSLVPADWVLWVLILRRR